MKNTEANQGSSWHKEESSQMNQFDGHRTGLVQRRTTASQNLELFDQNMQEVDVSQTQQAWFKNEIQNSI